MEFLLPSEFDVAATMEMLEDFAEFVYDVIEEGQFTSISAVDEYIIEGSGPYVPDLPTTGGKTQQVAVPNLAICEEGFEALPTPMTSSPPSCEISSRTTRGRKRRAEDDVNTTGSSSKRSKRQETAFSFFVKDRESKLTKAEKRKSAGGLNATFLGEWKDMTTKEKAPYIEQEKIAKLNNQMADIPENVKPPQSKPPNSVPIPCIRLTCVVDNQLPTDLANINPTLKVQDDFPWADAFASLGIESFDF